MKVLLLALAILLSAGVWYFNKLIKSYHKSGYEAARIVIIMKDQEPWVEGFLRKLFHFTRGRPHLEIVVVDDGSTDQTLELLVRLQGIYLFGLCQRLDLTGGRNPAGEHFFDVRGLTGNALLNAPVFSQLKALNAGKSSSLSK